MGKHKELDDTLGPYWNNFNIHSPRTSRNVTRKSSSEPRTENSIVRDLKAESTTAIPFISPQQSHPVFQPEHSSLTNALPPETKDNPNGHNNTDGLPSSSNSFVVTQSPENSVYGTPEPPLLRIQGLANQTNNKNLRTKDGVNHGTTTKLFKDPESVQKFRLQHKSFVGEGLGKSLSAFSEPSNKIVVGSSSCTVQLNTGEVANTNHIMSSRPGAGRRAGRDAGKDNDVEAELFNRVLDAVRKAKEYNDESQRLGNEILALEEEIKSKGRSTTEQHRRLDDLYRQKLRNAEAEKKVHDEEDIVNNLAILATMRSTDDTPAPRTGHHNSKSSRAKGGARSALDNDAIADSPGPTPSDSRLDMLKRGKDRGGSGTPQRSSSVASQHRSGSVLAKDEIASSTSTTTSGAGDTASTQHRGILAERAGTLIPGVEVFYKFPKGSPDDLGVGIQCVIKKVWADKKPNVIYDVQDPEPDPSGKINVHKATAKDLYPIPSASETRHLPSFNVGATVYARYPDTDTFYKARVVRAVKGDGEKSKGGGEYILRFEGEEDDKEQPVERRFVMDAKMKWTA